MTETMYKCLDTKLNTKVMNLKYFVIYILQICIYIT